MLTDGNWKSRAPHKIDADDRQKSSSNGMPVDERWLRPDFSGDTVQLVWSPDVLLCLAPLPYSRSGRCGCDRDASAISMALTRWLLVP